MEAWTLLLSSSSFFLSSFPLSHSLPFEVCLSPGHCGSLPEIGYPFWSEDILRPAFCGSDGFHLMCPPRDEEQPSIEIDSLTFNVARVNLSAYVMTLVRKDLAQDPCHPVSKNTSLSTKLFNLVISEANLKNVTLFYHCPQDISIGSNFTCAQPLPNTDPYLNPLVFYSEDGDHLMRRFPGLNNCKLIIKVPVSKETPLKPQGDIDDLKTALREGFSVQYNVAESCQSCMVSEGACGSNETSHQFACQCPDGPHARNCSDSLLHSPSTPFFISYSHFQSLLS